MDPIIRRNTKTRVNLACPMCGMDLKKAPNGGYVSAGETYCCNGCAEGAGCTCYAGTEVRKSSSRRGDIGWRNPENEPHDNNFNGEVTTTSEPIGKVENATHRVPSRDQRQLDPRSKRLKTQNKPRDSQREQARGRSEERGKLATTPVGRRKGSRGGDRISRTGSKGK